jgi:threonine/homoserine/homoserine lactone efflux protein
VSLAADPFSGVLDVAAAVAAMWGVAVVVPGPNFLAAARMAAARDRRAAMGTVAGIGAGTLLWGLAGCFGIRTVFALAPWLYVALKAFGAVYLIAMGGRIIAASFGPEAARPATPSRMAAVRLGFLTSISNPKSALFVTALFAAAVPPDAPLAVGLGAAAEMALISVSWYSAVVWLLSTRAASNAYLRARRWIDRAAGTVFAGFGARLLLGLR